MITLEHIKLQIADLSLGVPEKEIPLHKVRVVSQLICDLADKVVPGITKYAEELTNVLERSSAPQD